MSRPTLYLFDSYALIFRAYFAFSKNPLINSKGFNVSAISGFTSTLMDILKNQKPDYIACAFDAMAQTDRQAAFEFYKANRQETPEDIKLSIPFIKEIIKGFGIPILEVDGYEADDLIGTISIQAAAEGVDTYMVTPDKDMCQLVNEHVFVYKPPYMGKPYEVLGVKEVCEKWEVNDPIKVIDILGLMGDAVDNIPGVKGVGEKTAKKLIQDFGSVEGVYNHIDELKGALKNNLTVHKDMAMISKQLATIILDAPIRFDKEAYSISKPDKDVLSAIFSELEFRTLGKRILGEEYTVVQSVPKDTAQLSLFDAPPQENTLQEDPPAEGKNIHNVTHRYSVIEDESMLKDILEQATAKGMLSIDSETTGVDPNNCDLVGISFSFEPHTGYYLPWKGDTSKYVSLLNQYLGKDKLLKIGQNIKYDLLVFGWNGIHLKAPLFDTMLAHYLIDPDTKHSMDYLSETFLGYTPVSIESLIGKKGASQGSMADVPLEDIKEYAAEDADVTLQLYQYLQPELIKKASEKIFEQIEIPLIPVLASMEKEGVRIDADFLRVYSKQLAEDLKVLQEAIFEKAGVSFNMDSPKQLGEVLFEKMKIPYQGKKTKTGQYSTNEETLQKLAAEQPIVDDILNYRELAKLKSTYVDALPGLINPKTGRLHTTYNQTIAVTGRLSSTNPNLQNIPIRTDRGKEVRKAFIARDEQHTILSADYSQIELRIIASLSGDEKMIQAFKDGKDIHAATAANVYDVPLEEVTSTMRRNAKMVNFGIIYGISAFGLSQRLSIPRSEAAALIDQYFKQYPGIKQYMDECIAFARKHEYTQTISGRRRYLRDINSANFTVRGFAERNAINAPIQGTAADMIKLAMIDIDQQMQQAKMQSKMLLQVHDELLFDAYLPELDTLKQIVVTAMIHALPLNVPLEVGMGTGRNWLDAH